jgi:hypothetical protein
MAATIDLPLLLVLVLGQAATPAQANLSLPSLRSDKLTTMVLAIQAVQMLPWRASWVSPGASPSRRQMSRNRLRKRRGGRFGVALPWRFMNFTRRTGSSG